MDAIYWGKKLIKQVRTQDFPYTVEYTRLWERQIDGRTVFTVATQNNCIQGNFANYAEAVKLFDLLAVKVKVDYNA